MKFQNLSVKRLFGRVAMGLVLSMSGITIALFFVTKQTAVLLTGGALLLCALVGIFVLTQAFGKRLSQFTADLCQTLDHMIAGNEAPQRPEDSETQLARIGHRLARLYQIMQENRRRVDEERQELQTLVSDISHQVKTPVSNLKMATDTLLEKPMTEAERTDFIRGIRSQTDKLDFLFQALVKTSRLETGVIQLDKKPGRLFDTMPVSRRLNRWVSYHPPKNEKGRTDFLQVCTSFAICCHAAAILFFTGQVTQMFERNGFLPNEAEFSEQGAPRYGTIHAGENLFHRQILHTALPVIPSRQQFGGKGLSGRQRA